MTMRKFLLISFLFLLSAIGVQAQSNATYAVVSAMPHADVTNNDLVMFAHYNGSKYVWNTAYRDSFFAAFTNTATGVYWWQLLTNAATKATLNTASNTLQTQVTANLASSVTASNSLQTQVNSNLTSSVTASNSLQAQVTANLSSANTASNSLQSQITANLASSVTASNSLQAQVTANRFTTTNIFVSAEQTVFDNSHTYTIPHGLGVTPTYVRCVLVCKTADDGYLPGQELNFSTLVEQGSLATHGTVSCDSTNIYLVLRNTSKIQVCDPATQAWEALTANSYWRYKIYAKP